MKQSKKLALAGLLLANCSAFAATPMEGWYAGLMLGANYIPKVNFTLATPYLLTILPASLLANNQLGFRVGIDGGGQVGYRICNFRLEGQLLFSATPYNNLTLLGVQFKRHSQPSIYLPGGVPSIGGGTDFGAGIFNAYYDFFNEESDPSFVPYVGLGIGYAYVQNKISFKYITPLGKQFQASFKDNVSKPVAQLIVGTSYFYSDETAFALDFRYLTTNKFKYINDRLQNYSLNLSFNYSFGDN